MMPTLRIRRLQLALRIPLVTAIGTIRARTVWLVAASDGVLSGWGEAAPLPGFGGEAPERCELALERAATATSADERADALRGQPCAQAAVDDACRDLAARQSGASLSSAGVVQLNALAGSDGEAVAVAGATVVKLKSCGDPVADAGRLRGLHARLPQARFRLDANGAWDRAGAHAFARLAGQLVEYVEQPLAIADLAGCAALRAAGLRIALDESVRGANDLAQAIACQACDAVVLKPNWLGGASVVTDLVQMAAGRIAVILSSALGSAVERMHAAHLARRLALPGPHGLATGQLLTHDVAELPMTDPWSITIPSTPGLGIEVRP
jgi:o-succinylbenzoate synthase